MAEYSVVKVKNAGEKPNPHGGTLTKFYCSLQAADGSITDDVYWQRKAGSTVEVGDSVNGILEEGQYGPRFKLEQQQDGSSGVSRSNGKREWVPRPDDDPATYAARQAQIVHQHSQSVAVEVLKLTAPHSASPDELAETVGKLAVKLTAQVVHVGNQAREKASG